MKPLEFLADVLPSPGNGMYCTVELSTTRKEHQFVSNLEEIKPHVKRWLGKQRDIYFALATFEGNRRRAENAVSIRSIFIDMDGYESKKAAALALSEFLSKTGLDSFGSPHIVASGGGLHCYWPLTEDADITTWKPIAENFKRLCHQENLAIDMTVTADAARVLRIPGTMNFKKKYGEPRPVKFLLQGTGPIDLKRFGATVRSLLTDAYAPASNDFVADRVVIDGKRPTKAAAKRSAVAEAMMSNSVTHFDSIWLKSERGVGCAQLEYYKAHAAEDGMEPLWRGLLSWTKVCDDGGEYAVRLSEMHPYPPDRMRQKLADIKGPYPCIKMDGENPGVCPSCPHWGKITNALALGRDVRVADGPKVFDIPLNAVNEAVPEEEALDVEDGFTSEEDEGKNAENVHTRRVERGLPPKGFFFGSKGGIFAEIREKDATGVEVKTQVPVLPYDLFVVDMLRMEEKEHYAHLMAVKTVGPADTPAKQHTEYTPIIMPSKSVVSRDEILKCLATHNIYAAHGMAMDPYLCTYVRACVEESSLMHRAVDVPIQFGWQKDHSFVYNNRIFRPDGSEIPVPMPGLENINRFTASKGTLRDWRKPWDLIIRREMYTMLGLCLDSFGSTLMNFSDHEGFVWHIGSTESGTGKSLTLSLKAGVWGHPIRYRTSKGTSAVALQQRAGLLNSLPLLVDETTAKSRENTEWMPTLIFDIAEGQGKERMESGSNKERINNSTWSLTATLTSNLHLTDVLTGARAHSSNGELMRMLEWTPTKELVFSADELTQLKELRRNYGVAGEAWLRWLVPNRKQAQDIWQKTHAHLKGVMGFTDAERYWHAACTNTISAGILLGPKHAGILETPIAPIIDAMLELVERARAAHRRSARTAEDVLNAYTRDYYGKFIVLRKRDGQTFIDYGGAEGRTSTRSTVLGRIEHGLRHPGYVEYFIEEQLLKKHCAAMSFGYADFKAQMQARMDQKFLVRFDVKKDLLANTDGPSMRVNAMHLSIPVEKLDESGEISVG